MRFSNDVDESLSPVFESLPTFAGTYFDQARGGLLVVQLTSLDPTTESYVLSRAPKTGRIEFIAARSSFSELQRAYDQVRSVWPELTDERLLTVAISQRDNGLVLGVESLEGLGDLNALERALLAKFNVSIALVAAKPEVEASCSVDFCWDPIKAGTRIRQGSQNSTDICAMAFHFHNPNSGGKEFVTAGHCGWTGSQTRYQQGYGYLGARTATQYPYEARDIMRVDLPDDQVSNNIVDRSQDIEGIGNPIEGDPICVFRAYSNNEGCGFILHAFTSWTGDSCQCTMNGAQAEAISINLGDSGSPVYRFYDSTAASGIGVINTVSAKMVRLKTAMANVWWNWKIYTAD